MNIYKSITFQFILLASISIIISTMLTGFMSYNSADLVVIKKLKTFDLKNLVSHKTGVISIRLQSAIESSKMLATDPAINKWFLSNEKNDMLGGVAKERLTQVTELYNYSTVFAASNISKNYWKQNNTLANTLSEKNSKDIWFFDFLKSGKSIDFNLNSDKRTGTTQIFINVLMGTLINPVGIAGIGLDVTLLANVFSKPDYYDGITWLVDSKGIIKISIKPAELGKDLSVIIGKDNVESILQRKTEMVVLDIQNNGTGNFFLAHAPIPETNWIVVYAVSYQSVIGPLDTIKFTTLISGIISVILVIFVFYFVSHRFTRPIRELTKVAKLIAGGDLDKSFKSNSINEVGVLATAIDEMRISIKTNNASLEELNKNLEQKVIERTDQVNQMLDQLGNLFIESENKRMEIEVLAESRKRLSLVGLMAAGIVHDIKNPMATIKILAEMANTDTITREKREKNLILIVREMDRLNDLAYEILDFSKKELNLDLQDVNLREFISEIEQFLQIDFEYSGIKWISDLQYTEVIRIDKSRMRRVIINLAKNAIEAMHDGKKEYSLTIRSERVMDKIVLSLIDNGLGLPQAIEERIFEAFATEGKANGTGLGLFMSKWIVEAHNGKLTYETKQGEGTTFFIALPIE